MTDKKDCNRCGECCKVLVSPIKGMQKDDIEYLRARGLKEELDFFLIPHQCEQLELPHWVSGMDKPNIDDRCLCEMSEHTCKIHDHKPKTCRNFKGKKMHAGKLYYVPNCCTMKE